MEGKAILPVHCLVIESISVRGALGHVGVWVTKKGRDMTLDPDDWEQVYDGTHAPSWRKFVELKFEARVTLDPCDVRGVYVHSTLPGDEAIVYDNQKDSCTHRDNFITIHPGYAHVCNKAFGQSTLWGYGSPWRDRREFVGRIKYGVVYKLWHPEFFHDFGDNFQGLVRCLFMCQRRGESPLAALPDECIYYVLNMCRWDWVNDAGVYEVTKSRSQHNEGASIEDQDDDDDDDDIPLESTQQYAHIVQNMRDVIYHRGRFHGAFHFLDNNDYYSQEEDDEEWEANSDDG